MRQSCQPPLGEDPPERGGRIPFSARSPSDFSPVLSGIDPSPALGPGMFKKEMSLKFGVLPTEKEVWISHLPIRGIQ